MSDDIPDDLKPIRVFTNVTAARVEYYGDVVNHMAGAAIQRYVKKHKQQPSPRQIADLTAELARLTIIDRNPLAAQALEITNSST